MLKLFLFYFIGFYFILFKILELKSINETFLKISHIEIMGTNMNENEKCDCISNNFVKSDIFVQWNKSINKGISQESNEISANGQ